MPFVFGLEPSLQQASVSFYKLYFVFQEILMAFLKVSSVQRHYNLDRPYDPNISELLPVPHQI